MLACAAGTATTAAGSGGLGPRLTTSLTDPSLSLGKTGALAVDVATGEPIFAHNSNVPFAPASNEKLPVSYASLIQLGPGYRFHTEVYGTGTRAGATWDGNLVLKGFGDPTLGGADIERLAATVRGRGIRTVTGRVLGDESFYDGKRGAAGWKPGFLGGETPPLSALVVDRAKGWPALSPPLLAARALRDALERKGVVVAGRPGLGIAPDTATSLASDTSEPLSLLVRRMNQESDNFYAEMLLKQLAAAAGRAGTSAGGGRIVIATMKEAGIADCRRQDRRRVGALEPRSTHRNRPRRRAPGRCHGPGNRATVSRVSRRDGIERDAEHPAAVAQGQGEGKDRDDEPRVHALRCDSAQDRVRRAGEREPRVVMGCARGTGPVRDDPGRRGRRRLSVTRLRGAHGGRRPRGSARPPSPPSPLSNRETHPR